MPAEIVLQPSPNAAGLAEKREQLAAVRAALAEREADIAQPRSQLKAFEVRYLLRVGVLYAELDEIAARITEREVDLYDSDSARRRAQETHEAAFDAEQEPEEFDPSPSLKTLFREVASRSRLLEEHWQSTIDEDGSQVASSQRKCLTKFCTGIAQRRKKTR
jgi:hypothetical protein